LVDGGKVFEEKPRAVKECSQRSIMIDRNRINPGLDIGKVLHKERGHIRVDLVAIWNRQIRTGATPHLLALPTPRGLGELAQGKTVPNIPSDAWQLANAISEACDKLGEWTAHR
jgi:hypothetical protein